MVCTEVGTGELIDPYLKNSSEKILVTAASGAAAAHWGETLLMQKWTTTKILDAIRAGNWRTIPLPRGFAATFLRETPWVAANFHLAGITNYFNRLFGAGEVSKENPASLAARTASYTTGLFCLGLSQIGARLAAIQQGSKTKTSLLDALKTVKSSAKPPTSTTLAAWLPYLKKQWAPGLTARTFSMLITLGVYNYLGPKTLEIFKSAPPDNSNSSPNNGNSVKSLPAIPKPPRQHYSTQASCLLFAGFKKFLTTIPPKGEAKPLQLPRATPLKFSAT